MAQLATMLLEASPTVRPTNDWLPAFGLPTSDGLSADSPAQQANRLATQRDLYSEYPPDVPRQIDALQSRQQTGSLSSASNSHGGVTSRHDWQRRGQPLSSMQDPQTAGWLRAKPEPETAEWFRKHPMTSDSHTEIAGGFRGQPASAAGLQMQRSQAAGTVTASTSEHTQTTRAVPSYTQVLPEPPITPEQLSNPAAMAQQLSNPASMAQQLSNPASMVQQAGDQAVAAWRSLLDDQVGHTLCRLLSLCLSVLAAPHVHSLHIHNSFMCVWCGICSYAHTFDCAPVCLSLCSGVCVRTSHCAPCAHGHLTVHRCGHFSENKFGLMDCRRPVISCKQRRTV